MNFLFYFIATLTINDSSVCKEKFLLTAYNPLRNQCVVVIPILKDRKRGRMLTTNKSLFAYINQAQGLQNDTIAYLNYVMRLRAKKEVLDISGVNMDSAFKQPGILTDVNSFTNEFKRNSKMFLKKYTILHPYDPTRRVLKLNSAKPDLFPYLCEAIFESNYFIVLGDGEVVLFEYQCK